MYDNICKYIAENFSEDLATWLLGKPIKLTKLSPKELSNEPIRADSLILLQSDDLILHTEFQTSPDQEIPLRMADYRLRVYRRFPEKEMRQIVVYLRKSNSELVYQNSFQLTNLTHNFEVIRLWEQPTEIFLKIQGLLAFAILTKDSNKEEVLHKIRQKIDTIESRKIQADITAATYILGGLVLNKEIMGKILRRDIMKESVTYQEIFAEGEIKGKMEGKQEGREEGREEGELNAKKEIAINLLKQNLSLDFVVMITGLSMETVQQLQQNLT